MRNHFDELGRPTLLKFREMSVNFSSNRPLVLLIRDGGDDIELPLQKINDGLVGQYGGISYGITFSQAEDCFGIRVSVTNRGENSFSPEALALRLGIDTYMVQYPQWNECFFPTLLRCEKTHFYGYFMSPLGDMLGVGCKEPIAAYHLEYNREGERWLHRIEGVCLHLLHRGILPEHYPSCMESLGSGEELTREILLYPVADHSNFESLSSRLLDAPVLSAERYTVAKGEELSVKVSCPVPYKLTAYLPDGGVTDSSIVRADEIGEYRFTVVTENGREAVLLASCHRPWIDILDMARDAAFRYPQKATTHAESWYGFYSAFLAAKHLPKPELDGVLKEHFMEVIPRMFDLERGEPIVMPDRIQNSSTLIGVLTDLYESEPEKNQWALETAEKFAEFLISKQVEDGSYRSGAIHYTCVIYIAKSMLELYIAERAAGRTIAQRYFESAKRAVDDLVKNLEQIGTEGEHTLEDGMISCSALQIGMLALLLPDEERAPYIKAAEHMMSIHACLENTRVPDYRMNGGTLRFWESQYDVMLIHNCMNSPHGWTAWTVYAAYYLYLLTGENKYLTYTYNTMGACTSLMHSDGSLSWAFITDPSIKAKALVPDLSAPVNDSYRNVPKTAGYRGKWEEITVGECQYPMISDWYRTDASSPLTGGYSRCKLFLADRKISVDNQGGACDNDVHEIFKCMEETVMNKVFLTECDGGLCAFGGVLSEKEGRAQLQIGEDVRVLHCNLSASASVVIRDTVYELPKGRYFKNI